MIISPMIKKSSINIQIECWTPSSNPLIHLIYQISNQLVLFCIQNTIKQHFKAIKYRR